MDAAAISPQPTEVVMDERAKPGDEVGLGHVVEDRLPTEGTTQVDEASEDSFPASDAPGFTRDSTTPADGSPAPVPVPESKPPTP